MPILEIQDLKIEFQSANGWLCAVDGVSFSIGAGEVVGLVGESGSGKSVTALSIARLLPMPPARHSAGTVRLDGQEVLGLPEAALGRIRGGVVGYVFQEPGASLNPVLSIGAQLLEVLRRHRPAEARAGEAVRLLQQVGIPAPELRLRDLPHQLSGGMQQRVAIALAIAPRPRLLIADEPTTALDVTIQAQILGLLRDLNRSLGMAVLLITHNLGLVSDLAPRVLVMYAGQIVETGPTREVLKRPSHPYTRALIRSVPSLEVERERLAAIPGSAPTLGLWPRGCRFHPRCPEALDVCRVDPPRLQTLSGGESPRAARCPFATP